MKSHSYQRHINIYPSSLLARLTAYVHGITGDHQCWFWCTVLPIR